MILTFLLCVLYSPTATPYPITTKFPHKDDKVLRLHVLQGTQICAGLALCWTSIHVLSLQFTYTHTHTHTCTRSWWNKRHTLREIHQIQRDISGQACKFDSSPWHPLFWGQGMSSNFKCLEFVKSLFILLHTHTQGWSHRCTQPSHTLTWPTWHTDTNPVRLYTSSEVNLYCDRYTRKAFLQSRVTVRLRTKLTHAPMDAHSCTQTSHII